MSKSIWVCPVCEARLRYERIDDGTSLVEIDEAGEVIEISAESDGSTSIYCTKDPTHKIDEALFERIQRVVENEGY